MVLLLFSLTISLVCFWYGFKCIQLYFKVKNWTKVKASIISKKTELHQKYSTGRSPYAVKVDYTYIFLNNTYTNNKVYLIELIGGQVNHTEASAKKVINTLEDTIVIYVNPKNPQHSVIFCKGIILYVFIFLMGLASLLLGIIQYE